MVAPVLFSSKASDWETPPAFFVERDSLEGVLEAWERGGDDG